MRRGRGARLPAAIGLVLGGLVLVLVPAGTAAAAGTLCMGVVVDNGTGAAPAVLRAGVAPGTSDLQALSDVGQTPVQNGSGLVCAIAGYPADGLQDCLATSGSLYYYWSYWEGDPDTGMWTYASVGPASHVVSAGTDYVEGWRYQDPGPASPAATKPAIAPAAAFAQACPSGSGGGGGAGNSGSGAAAGSPTTTTAAAAGGGAAPTPPASGASSSSGGGAASSGAGGSALPRTSPSTTSTSPVTPSSSGGAGEPAGSGAGSTNRAAPPSQPAHASAPTDAAQHQAGGSPLLPVVLVSAVVAVIAALAWARWRRRPSGDPAEE